MTRRVLPGLALLATAACGRLQTLPASPAQTPESWLANQPWVQLRLGARSLVLIQPSSTALIYLLGLAGLALGLRAWRGRHGQRARAWWGLGLALWGLGALLAGTSYQAFGWEIKCAGRATCAWTSWWEVFYLLLTVAAVDALLVAQAHAGAFGRRRRALLAYAAANAGLYSVVVLAGAFTPAAFPVSFELLVLFAAPSVLLCLGLAGWPQGRSRTRLDRTLVGAWLGLIAALAAYYLYLVLGLTQRLWARGVWFSENDVLHAGLIPWMLVMGILVAPRLGDQAEP